MFATLNVMWHQFTAAAQRALVYASGWSNRTGCDELEAEPLLVGLLVGTGVPGRHHAGTLAIDISAVRRALARSGTEANPHRRGDAPQQPFSQEVELSLQLACQRLAVLPQPLELATEHILLGLAAADHEVSLWLRQQGLDPDALEAEICRLYGYRGGADVIDAGSCERIAEECSSDTTVLATSSATSRVRSATRDRSGAQPPLLRVLDAAANRAREGLRVVEDYVRFVLDDRHLTGLCKQLRHDLTDALGRVSAEHRLAARETQADVGTALTTAAEQSRADAAEVLAANFARLQESLRSLEEFGKLLDADLAAAFKQLRYRAYTLQRAVDITRDSIERLAAARLYVLIDGRPSIEEFERLARALIDAGVDVLQLRDKRLGDRELLDRARLLRGLTQRTRHAVDRQRSARPGRLGPGRRGARGPGGAVGEGRPVDRRAGNAGGRFDPQHRTGPAGGARRGQLHRRGPDVSLGHEAVRASFPAWNCCGRWRPRFACPPSPSAASAGRTSARCWRRASRGLPSVKRSRLPPTLARQRRSCEPQSCK